MSGSGKDTDTVSGILTCLDDSVFLSSSLLPSNSSNEGSSPGWLRPLCRYPVSGQAGVVFPGNHLTLTWSLFMASWQSFTVSLKCLIIAQSSTCSPRLISTPPPGRERDETRTLMSRSKFGPWTRDSRSVLNRSPSSGMSLILSSRRTGFLPVSLSPHFPAGIL